MCEVDKFQCSNKKCIESSRACNGVDDCGDSSDELDCGKILDNVLKTYEIDSQHCVILYAV